MQMHTFGCRAVHITAGIPALVLTSLSRVKMRTLDLHGLAKVASTLDAPTPALAPARHASGKAARAKAPRHRAASGRAAREGLPHCSENETFQSVSQETWHINMIFTMTMTMGTPIRRNC